MKLSKEILLFRKCSRTISMILLTCVLFQSIVVSAFTITDSKTYNTYTSSYNKEKSNTQYNHEYPDDIQSDNSLSGDSLSDDSLSDNSLSDNSLSDNSLSDNNVSVNSIEEDDDIKNVNIDQISQNDIFIPIQEETDPDLQTDSVSEDSSIDPRAQRTNEIQTPVQKPGKTTISSLTNPSKGKMKVTYKRVSKAAGYEVCYATNSSFTKSPIVVDVKGRSTTISNLPQGKTYYVKVRAYKIDYNGKKIYGRYSAKKKLKIKKGVGEVSAKVGRAVINSVKIVSTDEVAVNAKIKARVESSDEYYYLFALDSYSDKLSGIKPVAKVGKETTVNFKASLNKETSKSILQKKFVIAVKKSRKYIPLSTAKYITNPGKIAYFNYPFPVAASKKGLQINADLMTDVEELGVKNTAYNIILSDIIARAGEKNLENGIPYEYNGKTYWFNKSVVKGYDSLFIQTRERNIVVTGILLMGWRDDLKYLIHPKGRSAGHHYYMMNTESKKSRLQLEATFSFLAERYSGNAYVTNWVVGNEVNAYNDWNYAGLKSIEAYTKAYADEFRLVSTCMKSLYSNSRVYISLDNNWTRSVEGIYSGKQFLELFAQNLKSEGNIEFNIAYHPYSYPMTTSDFWNNNSGGLVRNSSNSKIITMSNLNYLTSYIKNKYGRNTRIILSETGFSSEAEDRIQAAAIAYAYYIAESNSMVDALIISRHVDNTVEIAQNLRTGLWTTKGDATHPNEWADKKKYSWAIFKYMDTKQGTVYNEFALNFIKATSWNSLISNFNERKYQAMSDASQTEILLPDGFLVEKKDRINLTPDNGKNTVYRMQDLNKNVLWGYSKAFSTPINFTEKPYFGTDVTVTGTSNKKVTVKLRFHSGANVLDAETVIRTGKDTSLVVNVGAWAYASSVDKIEVLFLPAEGGDWVGMAKAEMDLTMTGMMVEPE